jgi:mannose-6-phosphate isomerase class I
MISHIKRDMERKKKQFYAMIDTQLQPTKRARYTHRALNQFYNYTDLLADFTILNKIANDPRDTIVINAGSAHTANLSGYFSRI